MREALLHLLQKRTVSGLITVIARDLSQNVEPQRCAVVACLRQFFCIVARQVLQPQIANGRIDFQSVSVRLRERRVVLLDGMVLHASFAVPLGVEQRICVQLTLTRARPHLQVLQLLLRLRRLRRERQAHINLAKDGSRADPDARKLVCFALRQQVVGLLRCRLGGLRCKRPQGPRTVVLRKVRLRHQYWSVREKDARRELLPEVTQHLDRSGRIVILQGSLRSKILRIVAECLTRTGGLPVRCARVGVPAILCIRMAYGKIGRSRTLTRMLLRITLDARKGRGRPGLRKLLCHGPQLLALREGDRQLAAGDSGWRVLLQQPDVC